MYNNYKSFTTFLEIILQIEFSYKGRIDKEEKSDKNVEISFAIGALDSVVELCNFSFDFKTETFTHTFDPGENCTSTFPRSEH